MRGDRSRDPIRNPGRDRGDRGVRYCSNCGESLPPPAKYCPSCGTPTGRDGSSADGRTRSRSAADPTRSASATTDREILEHRIATAVRNGWELERDFGDHAVMVRRTFGGLNAHLLVALVSVWWTMGLGNVLYGAYRYVTDADRAVLWADDVDGAGTDAVRVGIDTETADRAVSDGRTSARLTAAVYWLVAAVTAGIGVSLSGSIVATGAFALASMVALAGVGALPSVRRRLDRRHSVLANGRVRSVDERAVVEFRRPCSACADIVGRGVERTYREDVCLFGVPLSTSSGRNYYCRRCANAERVSVPDPSAERSELPRPANRSGSRRTRNADRSGNGVSDTEREHT
ncbi:zinc-ribbon domain-containing protein [Halosolutus gelatinilyticus]|uniref:zinc-ribbon domain-containing protein n=1 Tax=Halosolutus gelatinilyticus TaxID=2931975 RepID=UPI001FF34A2D|nr:zinc-ribbon domain-containing protein [Halosolutus gelatinilyticus]